MASTNDELPLLSVVYEHYENDELEPFVEGAIAILENDHDLNRCDRIQLLIFLANCVEDDAETWRCLVEALSEFRTARACRLPQDVANLEAVGWMLHQMAQMTLAYPRRDNVELREWLERVEEAVFRHQGLSDVRREGSSTLDGPTEETHMEVDNGEGDNDRGGAAEDGGEGGGRSGDGQD